MSDNTTLTVPFKNPSLGTNYAMVIVPHEHKTAVTLSYIKDMPYINGHRIDSVGFALKWDVVFINSVINTPNRPRGDPVCPPAPVKPKQVLPKPHPNSPTHATRKWFMNATQRCLVCNRSLAVIGTACGHLGWCRCIDCGRNEGMSPIALRSCTCCQRDMKIQSPPLIPLTFREEAILMEIDNK